MWPPLISGGNRPGCVAGLRRFARFNGPPLISGESSTQTAVMNHASMGPPLISGGNVEDLEAARHPHAASMGPPLISGGNAGGRDGTGESCDVSRLLQWGRR